MRNIKCMECFTTYIAVFYIYYTKNIKMRLVNAVGESGLGCVIRVAFHSSLPALTSFTFTFGKPSAFHQWILAPSFQPITLILNFIQTSSPLPPTGIASGVHYIYICNNKGFCPYRVIFYYTVSFLRIRGWICELDDNLEVAIDKCWFTRNYFRKHHNTYLW